MDQLVSNVAGCLHSVAVSSPGKISLTDDSA